jgi:hypothetical protein
MNLRVILLFLFLISISNSARARDSAEQGSGKFCTQKEFGGCFTVHGRYAIYVEANGIWVIGTKHLLRTAGDADLDDLIYKQGDWQDWALSGDYHVCPLSAFHRGRMQGVCVQSYKNIRAIKRH